MDNEAKYKNIQKLVNWQDYSVWVNLYVWDSNR